MSKDDLVKERVKVFSRFSAKMRTGSTSRKKNANGLEMQIPGETVSVNTRMNLREAKAFNAWLTDVLKETESSVETEEASAE
jgi:hypothetical protein